MTHTYAVMHISKAAHDEITGKLWEAGYRQAFVDDDKHDGVLLDMHGIALAEETEEPRPEDHHQHDWRPVSGRGLPLWKCEKCNLEEQMEERPDNGIFPHCTW